MFCMAAGKHARYSAEIPIEIKRSHVLANRYEVLLAIKGLYDIKALSLK